jgi:hypothetical protein
LVDGGTRRLRAPSTLSSQPTTNLQRETFNLQHPKPPTPAHPWRESPGEGTGPTGVDAGVPVVGRVT